jgi:hypothetical protein
MYWDLACRMPPVHSFSKLLPIFFHFSSVPAWALQFHLAIWQSTAPWHHVITIRRDGYIYIDVTKSKSWQLRDIHHPYHVHARDELTNQPSCAYSPSELRRDGSTECASPGLKRTHRNTVPEQISLPSGRVIVTTAWHPSIHITYMCEMNSRFRCLIAWMIIEVASTRVLELLTKSV